MPRREKRGDVMRWIPPEDDTLWAFCSADFETIEKGMFGTDSTENCMHCI
jgi:hypothetical protein